MSKITEYIKQLNSSVADLASQEKAKNLRKKLLTWGCVAAGVGGLGVLICFISMATAGFDSFGADGGFSTRIMAPFCLIPIFAILLGVGTIAIKLGLSILIGGAAAKFIDKSTNPKCECGSPIKDDEIFCESCGKELRRKCEKCGEIQSPSSKYCKKCGGKLTHE